MSRPRRRIGSVVVARREAEIDVHAFAVFGRAFRPGQHSAELLELSRAAAGHGDQHLDVRCGPSGVDRHLVAELDRLRRLVCEHGPAQAPAAVDSFEDTHFAPSVGRLPEDGGH